MRPRNQFSTMQSTRSLQYRRPSRHTGLNIMLSASDYVKSSTTEPNGNPDPHQVNIGVFERSIRSQKRVCNITPFNDSQCFGWIPIFYASETAD